MPRVKLIAPKDFKFSTNISIRITDLNYGGHVGNDTILTIIHEARVQFLKHYQLSEMDFAEASLIMSDVAIEFKKELFYGNTVKIYVAITEMTHVGFEIFYKLVKDDGDSIVAIAKTGMVCYNYSIRKIVALPETIKQMFSNL